MAIGDAGVLPARHRVDMDVYYRMTDAGILGEGDRIEHIDGDLCQGRPGG